jgi:addiction module RelE/StbE family toxin
MGMREVYEHRRMTKVLAKLPDDILKRYEKWKDIVRISGPQGLRAIKGFHDEALRGEWKGHRSSRLSQQYRVIYQVEAEEVLIYVLDLTAHDYRRK